MYIESLSIENLRCIEEDDSEFQFPGRSLDSGPLEYPNINLLLGNNGAGKTTILKAIALSLLAPVIEGAGYVPYSMVRRRQAGHYAEKAEIKAGILLHDQDTREKTQEIHEKTSVQIERIHDTERLRGDKEETPLWDQIFDEKSPAFFIVGYGASRRVETPDNVDLSSRKRRRVRYQRVAGLFEEHVSLMPLEGWLPKLESSNPGRYKQVFNLINRLLPKGTSFSGKLEGGEYSFKHRNIAVSFGALSDGYRAYIGWIGDLLFHVCMGCPKGKKLVDNRGVVLIDEIDLHLHPTWQQNVIPTLSRALPMLQFVLTTHSSLVVGSLQKENILLLESERGASYSRPLKSEVLGLSADQILTSPAFEMESTRAPIFVAKMEEVAAKMKKGDRESSRFFSRMLTEGAGAMTSKPESKTPAPEWAQKLSKRLKQKK